MSAYQPASSSLCAWLSASQQTTCSICSSTRTNHQWCMNDHRIRMTGAPSRRRASRGRKRKVRMHRHKKERASRLTSLQAVKTIAPSFSRSIGRFKDVVKTTSASNLPRKTWPSSPQRTNGTNRNKRRSIGGKLDAPKISTTSTYSSVNGSISSLSSSSTDCGMRI